MASTLKPFLQSMTTIIDWNVDTEDIDKVLRIEAKASLKEKELMYMIQKQGFYCEVLNH